MIFSLQGHFDHRSGNSRFQGTDSNRWKPNIALNRFLWLSGLSKALSRNSPCLPLCFFAVIKDHHSSILPTEDAGSCLGKQSWKFTQNHIDVLGKVDILVYVWLPLLQCRIVQSLILFNGCLFYWCWRGNTEAILPHLHFKLCNFWGLTPAGS